MREMSFRVDVRDALFATSIVLDSDQWIVVNVPDDVSDEEVWEQFSFLMLEPVASANRGSKPIHIDYRMIRTPDVFWEQVSANLKSMRHSLGLSQKEVVVKMGYPPTYEKRFGFWEGGKRIPLERFKKIIDAYARICNAKPIDILGEVFAFSSLGRERFPCYGKTRVISEELGK